MSNFWTGYILGVLARRSLQQRTSTPPGIKKPIVAFFLALLFPGLGQVYNGQWRKGLLFCGIIFMAWFYVSGILVQSQLKYYAPLILMVLTVFPVFESVIVARRMKACAIAEMEQESN
jgi:hypothetical protein